MYDSSLFDNLKLISKEDWKEFRLFVDSEFNNRGSYKEETRWLCDYISGVYPDFQHKKLKKEKVLSALFKDKAVISGKLEKTMHELNSMCRNYLIWKSQNSEENSFYRDLEWLKILRESLDEDRYLLFMEKARKRFDAIEKVSPEYYYQKYLLEKEWHEWLSTVNRVRDDLNLVDVIKTFDLFSQINRLEIANHIITQSRITKIESQEYDLQLVHDSKPLSKYIQQNFLYIIYYDVNKLLNSEHPHPDSFSRLITTVENFEGRVESDSLKLIYTHIRNICSILIDSNNLSYINVLHGLQKKSLEKGHYQYKNRITLSAYVSITKIAVDTKNLNWAIDFVEYYKDKLLNNDDSENFYLTNKAICLFAQKNYESVLDYLPQFSTNTYYHLFIRKLEIKSYYELESDLLTYKLESFKIYLIRSHAKFMGKRMFESHYNFVKILIRAANLPRNDINKHKNLKLKIDKILQKNEGLIEKIWLIEKIDEIEQKSKRFSTYPKK